MPINMVGCKICPNRNKRLKTICHLCLIRTDFTNKIVVIGVGGGGGNAINNMVEDKFEGIDYVAINTDMQHLELSHADYVYAIGQKSAEGYGAGADPNRGEAAALEDEELIAAIVENSKLVILTAGFGKGTGTGATPVIARIAKNMKKLVVAVITTPFPLKAPGIEIMPQEEYLTLLKRATHI